jgi:hypothetical protein
VDASIAAHRERSSESLGALLWSNSERDDLLGDLLFLQSDSLLDSDLAEGIHAVLDGVLDDAGAIWLDADLDSVINHALNTDSDTNHSERKEFVVYFKSYRSNKASLFLTFNK